MTWHWGEYTICEVIIRRIPLGVVAIDDSTLSLERSTKEEMVACSPKAVSPRESTDEETNRRDDVDQVGVVLGDLENNLGHRLQLFEECPWLCSEGAGEMVRLKMLSLLEDFWNSVNYPLPCRARDNKQALSA